MNASFLFTVVSFFIAGSTLAATPCDDAHSECREDCSIEFGGSTQLVMKKKFDGCIAKCAKTAGLCTERAMETERSGLDEGALKDSPGSREVDSDGFSTAPRRGKAKAARAEKDDGNSFRDSSSETAPKVKAPASRSGPELKEGEIPKSNRSEIKVDPKEEARLKEEAQAAKAKTAEPVKPASDEPASPRVESVPRMAESRKASNDELRDDIKPSAKPPPSTNTDSPVVERKTVTKKAERKKESDDDLRNF